MGISPELADFLIKNAKEISFVKSNSIQYVLQLTVTKAEMLKNEKISNVIYELHSWFMLNANGQVAAFIETDKYSSIFPYQFYATIPFDGMSPESQHYVFQFTYTPKVSVTKVTERKTIWNTLKKYVQNLRT